MIRTRDFLVFVIAVVFLTGGITSTWLYHQRSEDSLVKKPITFSDTNFQGGAVVMSETDDRQSNISRLKQKLAAGGGGDDVPIFTSIDETAAPEIVREINYCPDYKNSNTLVGAWQNVEMKVVEGARLYLTKVQVASSTEEIVLLQLPSLPIRTGSAACLSSNVVGVTTGNHLILNTEADRWRGSGLIGYALDGFPIYAKSADEALLDECGGADFGSGYAYNLRAGDDFILACYTGIPTKIE